MTTLGMFRRMTKNMPDNTPIAVDYCSDYGIMACNSISILTLVPQGLKDKVEFFNEIGSKPILHKEAKDLGKTMKVVVL